MLVVFSVFFFDRIKIDDPVGAISVHGVCGAWGVLSIGLFATYDDAFLGREDAGLFYGGGFEQLAVQALIDSLEPPARDLIDLFNGTEYLVDQELDTEAAAAFQRRLEGIGAYARVEPVAAVTSSARRLLQMPGTNDPAEAGLMQCPACGHTQLVDVATVQLVARRPVLDLRAQIRRHHAAAPQGPEPFGDDRQGKDGTDYDRGHQPATGPNDFKHAASLH